jgi:predicted transcriptional regulator of viral defense system
LNHTAATHLTRTLAAAGRYHFTSAQAEELLGVSRKATQAALRRLKQKGELAVPFRGFHIIVTPDYAKLGSLPPNQFVPQLMDHLREPYYVGLLSAAQYHGAAHQQPQAFQVMVRKNRNEIRCGGVRVEFIARHDLEDVPTTSLNTPRGTARVATPEATAIDLVGYPRRAAGLSNVATVISELAESLKVDALVEHAKRSPIAWVQRLGFVLKQVGQQELANALQLVVAEADPAYTRLAPWLPKKGTHDTQWRLVVNDVVEPDV